MSMTPRGVSQLSVNGAGGNQKGEGLKGDISGTVSVQRGSLLSAYDKKGPTTECRLGAVVRSKCYIGYPGCALSGHRVAGVMGDRGSGVRPRSRTPPNGSRTSRTGSTWIDRVLSPTLPHFLAGEPIDAGRAAIP